MLQPDHLALYAYPKLDLIEGASWYGVLLHKRAPELPGLVTKYVRMSEDE